MNGLPTGEANVQVVDLSKIDPVMCPCGPSRRWKLHKLGFGFDVHNTTIQGSASPHQHLKTTVEVFIVLSCAPGTMMKVGTEEYPLHPKMAIAVPMGVVHEITGDADVIIVVIGGHNDSDFFDAEGNPL